MTTLALETDGNTKVEIREDQYGRWLTISQDDGVTRSFDEVSIGGVVFDMLDRAIAKAKAAGRGGL